MSLPAAFATKAVESTCTVWVGATNNKGYGMLQIDGRLHLAHRVAYENAHGPIPDGVVIDHLEAVTQSENVIRGRAAAALAVGDECINGHAVASELDLYRRSNGKTECRKCRSAESHRTGRRRPTVRLQSDVAASVHRT